MISKSCLIQLLFGLLVCYCHLEKYFLLDCTKVLTLLTHYRDNYIKQDKNQSGITLQK
jgi:hypothetical protein